MNFVYVTPKTFPGNRADDFYTKSLALALNAVCENFLLLVADNTDVNFTNIRYKSFDIKTNRNNYRALFYFQYFVKLYFFAKSEKNLINTVFFVGDPNIALMLFFLKFFKKNQFKIVVDWHLFFETFKYRFIATHSDYAITTSNRLRENIINKLGGSRLLTQTVYGGVELNPFNQTGKTIENLRNELNIPQSAYLVGYVGFFQTMHMEKGIGIMIEALSHLSHKKIEMVFVGGYPGQIAQYTNLARKFSVENKVHFIGVIPNEKVALYELAMNALVIPYPNKPHFRESGFPMKVYEYMATQNPVIYSKLELIDEVLATYGYAFTPDDAKNLATVIEYVHNNPVETRNRAKKAYQKNNEYTWAIKANSIKKIAQSLTN